MKESFQVFSVKAGDVVFLTSKQTDVNPRMTIFELAGNQQNVVCILKSCICRRALKGPIPSILVLHFISKIKSL